MQLLHELPIKSFERGLGCDNATKNKKIYRTTNPNIALIATQVMWAVSATNNTNNTHTYIYMLHLQTHHCDDEPSAGLSMKRRQDQAPGRRRRQDYHFTDDSCHANQDTPSTRTKTRTSTITIKPGQQNKNKNQHRMKNKRKNQNKNKNKNKHN